MTWILYEANGDIRATSSAESTIDELIESGFTGTKVDVGDSDTEGKQYVGGVLIDIVKSADEIADERRDERQMKFAQTIDKANHWWEQSLTDAQKAEVATWRQAWLDYPSTGVKPDDIDVVEGLR